MQVSRMIRGVRIAPTDGLEVVKVKIDYNICACKINAEYFKPGTLSEDELERLFKELTHLRSTIDVYELTK